MPPNNNQTPNWHPNPNKHMKSLFTAIIIAIASAVSMPAATLLDWDLSNFQSKSDGTSAAEIFLGSSLSGAIAGLSLSDLRGFGDITYSSGGGAPEGELNVKLNSGYIEYTMTADGSNEISLTKLTTSFYRNGSGAPKDYAFQVSVDGGNFEQFGGTIAQSGTGGTYIDESVTGEVTGNEIVIRFQRASSGVGNIHMNALAAVGSVVPEPATYALIAGLLGLTSVMLRRRK